VSLFDITVSAVQDAIDEFDRLGRGPFLTKYGFGKSRGFLLLKDRKYYDSKAIAGAAHGYLPGRRALKPNEFSGGEATVERMLERLGFAVVGPEAPNLPSPGQVLTNEQICHHFSVGNMGGMRRSLERNLLVLMSDPFKGLYQDRWEGDVLHYTGMGKIGDQGLAYAQNKTLDQSPRTGIAVHLLEALEPERYTYAGEVELIHKPYRDEQVDDNGKMRSVWMFPIKVKQGGMVPELTVEQARAIEESQRQKARQLSTDELKERAKRAKKRPSLRNIQAAIYERDAAVAVYAKRLAKGICDLCEEPAPFLNKKEEAYLECHHIIWLAKGGEDTIENTVALCPNCHRKMHVVNGRADKVKLQKKAAYRSEY